MGEHCRQRGWGRALSTAGTGVSAVTATNEGQGRLSVCDDGTGRGPGAAHEVGALGRR